MRKDRLILVSTALFLTPLGAFAATRPGDPEDPNFAESVYATGLSGITSLAWASDGSNTLFVAVRTGTVRVLRNGSLQATAFATVSPVYTGHSETGVIGLALDPDYASNRYVYVFVTESASVQKIYRYTAGTDASGNLVGSGKTQIGPDLPCEGVNHDGGGLAFGPDGHLYFGVGNLGNDNNIGGNGTSTERTSLGSKIGCMTSSGAAVASNPWYNASDGITATDYVFAQGMRNPFGLRFHPTTGALWVFMVGDDYEQIFLVPRGGNAGWPTENNTSASNGLLIPKLAYPTRNSPFGRCITRGVFYDGTAFPASYRGNLFFVDYVSGKVMRSVLNSSGDAITSTEVFVSGNSQLVDIVVGPDGALYYAGHGGTVYRLSYTGVPALGLTLSATELLIDEGGSGTFTVSLSAAPTSNVTVFVEQSAGPETLTINPSVLQFTPGNWNSPQTVTVSAGQDSDAVTEGARVSCSAAGLPGRHVVVTVRDDDAASGAPRARLRMPEAGARVSGPNAEFFGDGEDPQGVGTLERAEFYIDGTLAFTDSAAGGHYHFGGGHNLWDTRGLSNGVHILRLTVYDSGGLSGSHEIEVDVFNPVDDGDGGGGCGALGIEPVLAALALRALLRRRG
ncbi:MAG TPA: PQQ-dependent sugar dehydrogenase [Planctomycetota bacterium]|nr:PQQ-dependent sugar dehydrogenase [Planctomycetota bacterium]